MQEIAIASTYLLHITIMSSKCNHICELYSGITIFVISGTTAMNSALEPTWRSPRGYTVRQLKYNYNDEMAQSWVAVDARVLVSLYHTQSATNKKNNSETRSG